MYSNRELVVFYVNYKLTQREYPTPMLISEDATLERESDKAPDAPDDNSLLANDGTSGDQLQTPSCPHGDIEVVKTALRYSVDRFELLFAQRFSDLDSYIDMCDTTYESFKMTMDQVFKDGINWGRIAGLFAFGGIISVKCAERGLSDLVHCIVDWMTCYLDEHINPWIQSHGGWDYFAKIFLGSAAAEVTRQSEEGVRPWMLAGGTVLTGALFGMLVWKLK
ncbi:bcl-2-like protein 1 [Dunckerocampus dactyliophorus]|uniref:bcl-2-like protein 1 n=1 Tax=Dunckerocampus dactyliophorus TaxID=161453 RepID=UPI0024069C8C|nr:bcl-2-like protein 1 [Dunckerocampus dactyliophorus]